MEIFQPAMLVYQRVYPVYPTKMGVTSMASRPLEAAQRLQSEAAPNVGPGPGWCARGKFSETCEKMWNKQGFFSVFLFKASKMVEKYPCTLKRHRESLGGVSC